jgi:tripartite-type tricarboxylate transporter receptor subunit TctC
MPNSHQVRILSAVAGLCVLAVAGEAMAQASVENFYKGKSVDLIVGGDAAGGYDVYGRTVARSISKHIPGNPTIVVKNMPGAGSNKAAEFIYSVAPKDGSVFGIVFPGAIMTPLLDPGRLKFDPPKFNYLGTANKEIRVCAMRSNAAVKTMEDAMKGETIIAATADGGSTQDYPAVMNEVLGTKFKIIRGYKGTKEITLAVERGEADGLCGWAWTSLKTQKPDWLENKGVNIFVQFGMENDPELDRMGVPSVWKFVKNDSDKQLLELMVGQQVFGRPFVAPPGVPEATMKALRDAFAATMKDPGYLADAEKAKLEVDYDTGENVQKLVARIYQTPKPVVDRLIKAMKQP